MGGQRRQSVHSHGERIEQRDPGVGGHQRKVGETGGDEASRSHVDPEPPGQGITGNWSGFRDG